MQKLRLHLAGKENHKAHIGRTVIYVLDISLTVLPHLATTLEDTASPLSLSNYSCLPLTVHFRAESTLFYTFHTVRSSFPIPHQSTGSAVSQERSRILVTFVVSKSACIFREF